MSPHRGWCALLVAAACAVFGAGTGWARAGSTSSGREVYDRQCVVCHATEAEYHKEGPSLAGVYGRRAGTAPFFTGYRALKGADFVWTDANLDAWLADPRAFAGGRNTTMTLSLTDPRQRADVIAYLKTLR